MPFTYALTVLATDIDGLGHANNVVYVRWVVEAAIAHSSAVGLGPAEYLARKQVFVVRRQLIDYLRPALEGDTLAIETRVTALGIATSTRQTVITRARDGEVLARAVTDWAYIDLVKGRPVRIPIEVRSLFVVEAAHEK